MDLRVRVDTSGALLSGKAPEVLQAGLDAFVEEAALFLLAEVKKRTPQGVFGAQGGLLGSIQKDVSGKGTPMVKGVVMSAQPYVEVVEKGRRPGKGIPIDYLTRWIQVKLGVSDPDVIRRVAITISTRAKKYGIEGAHMFEKALNENASKIETMAKRHGLKIATELNA